MKKKAITFADALRAAAEAGSPDHTEAFEGEYLEVFEGVNRAEPDIFDPSLFASISFSSIDAFDVVLTASDEALIGMTELWAPALDKIVASAGIKEDETERVEFRFENVSNSVQPQYLLQWYFEAPTTLSFVQLELVDLSHLVRWIGVRFEDHRMDVAKARAIRAELSSLWWRTLVLPELRHYGFRVRQRYVATDHGRSEELGAEKNVAERKKYVQELHAKNPTMPRNLAVKLCQQKFGVGRERASKIMSTFGWLGLKGRPPS